MYGVAKLGRIERCRGPFESFLRVSDSSGLAEEEQ